MLDCMIASVAWRLGASILANDADLDRVARVIGVRLEPASHSAA
jgi:predicted nucleic acid-binding protein